MKNLTLTERDLAELAHLIPPSFVQIIHLIGTRAAWALLKKWGGTFFPVGQNQRETGKKMHAMLVAAVGSEDSAQKLETAFFAQRGFYVPKCDDAFRELRNRHLRRDFDALITQQPHPMPAYLAVRNLALEYGLSERRVWGILKHADILPQPSLFDEIQAA